MTDLVTVSVVLPLPEWVPLESHTVWPFHVGVLHAVMCISGSSTSVVSWPDSAFLFSAEYYSSVWTDGPVYPLTS